MVDSSLHPDTKKPVPLPFRLAAFTPTNLSELGDVLVCDAVLIRLKVIVGGMLAPNPSVSFPVVCYLVELTSFKIRQTIFWVGLAGQTVVLG